MSDLQHHVTSGLQISRTPQPETDVDVLYVGFETWPHTIEVEHLAFDTIGQLWGCGQGGVMRWIVTPTQTTFKIWHSEHGLAGNDACALHITATQVIVGHLSGWLSIFQNNIWKPLDTKTRLPIRAIGGETFACTDKGLFDMDGEELYPTPEAALGFAEAFGTTWLIAPSGLWKYSDEWQLIYPMVGLSQLVAAPSRNRLWVAGINGVAYLDSDQKLYSFTTKLPIEKMVLKDSTSVFLSTPRGVYLATTTDESLQNITKHRVKTLASSQSAHVFGDLRQIYYYFDTEEHDPKRELLPAKLDTPSNARRLFSTPDQTWLQDHQGYLWHSTPTGWTKLLTRGSVNGVVAFKGQVYVGFDDRLATLEDHTLNYHNQPMFITKMIATNEYLYIATLDGLYVSSDGQQWSLISYPLQMGIVRCLTPDRIVASDGIYALQNQKLVKIADFEQSIIFATIQDNEVWTSTGSQLFCDNVPISLNGRITSLCSTAQGLFVGTTEGLWKTGQNWQVQDSGLAGKAILDLTADNQVLWVLTNHGMTRLKL